MSHVVETIEFERDGVRRRLLIEYDEHCSNPRGDLDEPLGTTVSSKGTDYVDHTVDHWRLMPEKDGKIPYFHGYENGEREFFGDHEEPIRVMALHKSEHGPGTVHLYPSETIGRTGWDSGQIGWVYVTHDQWKHWQGEDWVDTPENQETLERIVRAELEEYAAWCRGSCYAFRVERFLPACEHGHSAEWIDDDDYETCGGFIGEYPEYGGAMEEGCSACDIQNPYTRKEAA